MPRHSETPKPKRSGPGGKRPAAKSRGPGPGAPPRKGQTRQRIAEQGGTGGKTPIRSTVEGVEPQRGKASKKTRSRKAVAQGIPQYVPPHKRKPVMPAKPKASHAATDAPVERFLGRGKPVRGKTAQQETLAYGRHPVMEAFAREEVVRLHLLDTLRGSPELVPLEAAAREQGVPVEWVRESYFTSRIGTNPHQGVMAQVKPYKYATMDELRAKAQAARDAGNFAGAAVLVLDGIEDPGNLGGILRTAAGLGIAGVIIPNRRAAGVTAAVRKTSAGTAGLIPLVRVANLRYALEELKEAGWWGVAATAAGTLTPSELPRDIPLVLVIGSEHEGISPLLLQTCDYSVRIPLHNGVESLNAGAAAAILLAAIAVINMN